jgi:hypothetical protein
MTISAVAKRGHGQRGPRYGVPRSASPETPRVCWSSARDLGDAPAGALADGEIAGSRSRRPSRPPYHADAGQNRPAAGSNP